MKGLLSKKQANTTFFNAKSLYKCGICKVSIFSLSHNNIFFDEGKYYCSICVNSDERKKYMFIGD